MKAADAELKLLEDAAEALRRVTGGRIITTLRHLEGAVAGRDTRYDAELVLDHERQRYPFLAEAKRNVTSKSLTAVTAQLRSLARHSKIPVLLVTDYLTPSLAEALIKEGIQHLDAAGNAYLSHDAMFVCVQGQKRSRGDSHSLQARTRSTWGRGALPVIHRMLNEPEALSMSYREIAALCTVSVGTVHNTVDDLRREGFLKTIGKRVRLVDVSRLFEQWVASYPQYLRERLVRRRFVIPRSPPMHEVAEQQRKQLGEADWVLGGEGAAWLMDHYLKPDTLTVYGNGNLDALCELLAARPAADGPIEVLQAFWTGHTSPGGRFGLADPILVYADLVCSGDSRAMDAAMRIRDDHLHFSEAARE